MKDDDVEADGEGDSQQADESKKKKKKKKEVADEQEKQQAVKKSKQKISFDFGSLLEQLETVDVSHCDDRWSDGCRFAVFSLAASNVQKDGYWCWLRGCHAVHDTTTTQTCHGERMGRIVLRDTVCTINSL